MRISKGGQRRRHGIKHSRGTSRNNQSSSARKCDEWSEQDARGCHGQGRCEHQTMDFVCLTFDRNEARKRTLGNTLLESDDLTRSTFTRLTWSRAHNTFSTSLRHRSSPFSMIFSANPLGMHYMPCRSLVRCFLATTGIAKSQRIASVKKADNQFVALKLLSSTTSAKSIMGILPESWPCKVSLILSSVMFRVVDHLQNGLIQPKYSGCTDERSPHHK